MALLSPLAGGVRMTDPTITMFVAMFEEYLAWQISFSMRIDIHLRGVDAAAGGPLGRHQVGLRSARVTKS